MKRNAFTLVELLVVVAIIIALLAILMPSMGKAIDTAQAAVCMSNLRQQGLSINTYQSDHFFTYPDHRTDNIGAGTGPDGYDAYWATTLFQYGMNVDVFHCPTAGAGMTDHGITWDWAFDQNNIGYGYNGWFLGIRLYSDQTFAGITTKGYYKLSQTLNPAMNIVIADSAPRGVNRLWSQSIWWPNSGTANDEGVVDSRHLVDTDGTGVTGTLWADGHTELRTADSVNPEGQASTLDKIEIWDPLQRRP